MDGAETQGFGNFGYCHVAFANHYPAAVELGIVNILFWRDLQIVFEEVLQCAAGDGKPVADLVNRQRLIKMFIDIFDDFFDELVLEMLIDGRRWLGILFPFISIDGGGQIDEKKGERCDHNIAAEKIMIIGAGNEAVNHGNTAAAAGEHFIKHVIRQWFICLEDNGQVRTGVGGGDALIVKLTGSVNHCLLGKDFKRCLVNGGMQRAVIDIG